MTFFDITHILNVRQPWASLIMFAGKDLEIRTQRTNIRGLIGVRASLTPEMKLDLEWLEEYGLDNRFFFDVAEDEDPFPKGVILGTVNLVGCDKIESKEAFRANVHLHMNDPNWWQEGLHSWELKDPVAFDVPVEYTPPRGAITWIRTEGLRI